MRLFLMAVLCGSVLAGCKKDDSKAGALNVTVGYSGFTRGCVTVTATDVDDAQNTSTLNVAIPGKTPGSVSVAVFREKDWGRVLNVTTQLREFDCDGTVVGDPQAMKARVPEEGKQDVAFTVRAADGDGDGYFSSIGAEGIIPGTDCDDVDIAVNPRATEVCNSKDDNCTLGESDANNKKTWYMDGDGDGYGSTQVDACTQPVGAVAAGGDCADDPTRADDKLVRPDQAEFRCDGKDDNCNGMNDESFSLDSDCKDELKCAGKIACAAPPSQTACARLQGQNPVTWFVDSDGDGSKGQDAGMGCESPVDGGVSESQDCDESSVFVKNGLPEDCDRLDNNCSTVVDEGCTLPDWTTDAGVIGTSVNLTSMALYDQGGKGWIAGTNKLAHLDSTGSAPREYADNSCQKKWRAIWAAQDGRVFVVGEDGWLSTRRFVDPGEPCFTPQVTNDANNTDFNGVVGFDDATVGATIYAVASNGKIYRWAPPYDQPGNLSEIEDVAANLRAISGSKSVDTLLAVGNSDTDGRARAYHFNPPGSPWSEESLGATDESFLRAVHVLNSHYAYAAGDNGRVFERTDGPAWRALPQAFVPNGGATTPDLLDVLAFSKNGIYAVTTANTIEFFNGNAWSTEHTATKTLRSLDGLAPTRFGAAGDGSTIVNFTSP